MAFFDDFVPGMLVGAAAVLVAPVLLKGGRPVFKAAVKAGLSLADSVKESMAETEEIWSDLVAEVRAETSQATAAVTKPSVSTPA